jgi:hypothetical protein
VSAVRSASVVSGGYEAADILVVKNLEGLWAWKLQRFKGGNAGEGPGCLEIGMATSVPACAD